MEQTLTAEQRAWAKKLEKHLQAMPAGIEILLGFGHIDVHPAGWFKTAIYDGGVDMMNASALIDEASLHHMQVDEQRIRPNSETI